ncbi:hypothetical protein L6164_006821 [Bauhinia variegata]|uniref:Uncharacterized protein n=1 Tax=Bauhinia variegata TaxID=167791 RepID=A0ACB9PX46_BAUVA|nr:hypothetical protein L6164_006821 [Bauhinia variegata]
MVVDKAKKSKIEEDDSDSIDSELIQTVEKLQQVQEEIEKFNEEASEKILEIEQKYNEIRKPVYDRRNEIIKTIPDFWLTAFLSHPMLSDLLSEEDQKIFKYVDSFDVEDFKDMQLGYTITFNFKENPYFENEKLTKTLAFFDDEPTKITGTAIKWKEGVGASNGVNRKRKGNKRPYAEESFFSWFSETPKEVAEFTDEVAEIIKDDLWPNPLKYLNNDADEDSDGDDDVEEEDNDEEDHESDNNGQS